MVKRFSAQLHVPNKHRIPVPYNHTDMVKFHAPSDITYQLVVSHVQQCLNKVGQHVGKSSCRNARLHEYSYQRISNRESADGN